MRFLLSLVAATAALAAAQDFELSADDPSFESEFGDFEDTFGFEDSFEDDEAPVALAPPAPAPQDYASGSGYGSGGGYYPPPPPPRTTTRPPVPVTTTIPPAPITTTRPPPPVTTTTRPPVTHTPDPPTPCPICPTQSSCPKPPAPTVCPEPVNPVCPSGAVCGDRNECEEGTHNCHELAKCTNTKGSFTCKCEYGTLGDGIRCAGPATCGATRCDSRGTEYACCTEISRTNEGIRQINNPPVCMCNVGLRGNGATGNCNGTDICATVARYAPVPFAPARIANQPAGQCFQGSTCTRIGVGNAYICANPANCPKWQVGRTEVGSQWVTVKFNKVFVDTPVVIAGPPTSRENDAVTVLISKVDTTGFQVKLQEPASCTDGQHVAELITWLAVLPGENINVGGNNIYITAGSQIVPMNSDTPIRQTTQLPNTVWAVSQVQDSGDGEITAAYTSYTAQALSLQVAAAATRRSQAIVGYVAFHGIALTNWWQHPTQRYNQFVGADCDNTPHLFFLGEDQSVPYENQFRPISGYWCIAPRNPWVIAGWSRFNGGPLVMRAFTAAQRGPAAPVPSIPFTNFRIQRFRASSIQVRAETSTCNSLDEVYSTVSTTAIGSTFASAFNYVAILPGYSSCCIRNAYVPAPVPPASAH